MRTLLPRALATPLTFVLAVTVLPEAAAQPVASAPAVAPVVSPSAGALPDDAARLKKLGCFIGAPSAAGVGLQAATIRFQAANGLDQSGRITARTAKRLAAERAVACDERPVPKRAGSGRRIVMSQGQNWIWLVEADGSVAAQGGVVDNDWLPQRRYVTGEQCGKPGRSRYRSDLTGALSIDYFVRFHDCIVGFHQIPVSKRTGEQIHPDYLAGTDLSKSRGCIRLPRPLILQLWRFTKAPTTVVVTR